MRADANNLPCSFLYYDEAKQRDVFRKPGVACEYACKYCGFNPEEKERRLEMGKFVERGFIKTLRFPTPAGTNEGGEINEGKPA